MSFHTGLSLAKVEHFPAFKPVHSIMLSIHISRCRPLPLFPSVFPSSISFIMLLCLFMCPKYFNFLICMVLNKFFCTCNLLHTSSFDTLSDHFIFPILRKTHISNASMCCCIALFIVQVSHPYKSTEKTFMIWLD